ncbi:hypothetical protein ABXN37_26095 [Piscinibacter sakaiensis]|uniref:ABC-2 type transport system permease protein n=1 Tax=Piscinibacter sakaiensis TaxID=1547922 RepID=A0A0K8P7F7_PISS1|nr:hypothetical protein [Piscinibacter sakaiensis]GAP38588.1 hypothetical protein ISF6_5141 [Piscinibacter sakaiensis]
MDRFLVLLHREWMQHHRGWLILALAPPLLALVFLPVAQFDVRGELPEGPALLALALLIYLFGALALASASMVFQASGLARRDQQDRSIEFWQSLPVSHLQSVGATVLMHLLLWPLMVLLLAFVAGQVVAFAAAMRLQGSAALAVLADPAWWGFSAAMLVRLLVGVPLAMAWFAPLVLVGMAAAAWLKRWGVPGVFAAVVFAALVGKRVFGTDLVLRTVGQWVSNGLQALTPMAGDGFKASPASTLESLTAAVWTNLGERLRDLADPYFAVGLAFAAAGFALLVLKRARG